MRVAVCTLCINDWYQEIVKYGVKTIENYAQRHGYDFYICNEVYDGERDCPWYKIKAIQKILPRYDLVFWIDADGHVEKPEQDITHFLGFLGNKDLLCAKDYNSVLNTGLMVIRNTPFIHALLDQVWNNKEPFDPAFHEQASMTQIFEKNRLGSRNKIEILPIEKQHILFSYWGEYFPGRSFFLHVARCAHDPVGFVYTLDLYCPIRMEEDLEKEYEDRIDWLAKAERCRPDIDQAMAHTIGRTRMSTRCILYQQRFLSQKGDKNPQKQN